MRFDVDKRVRGIAYMDGHRHTHTTLAKERLHEFAVIDVCQILIRNIQCLSRMNCAF